MARAPQGIEDLNLENLNDDQLQQLQEHVRLTIDERFQNRVEEYRRIARSAGYELTLTRIGEGDRRRRGRPGGREDRRSEIAPKYRNPDNPSETWTGRGREPRWLQHHIATGKSKEEFLIERQREPAA